MVKLPTLISAAAGSGVITDFIDKIPPDLLRQYASIAAESLHRFNDLTPGAVPWYASVRNRTFISLKFDIQIHK